MVSDGCKRITDAVVEVLRVAAALGENGGLYQAATWMYGDPEPPFVGFDGATPSAADFVGEQRIVHALACKARRDANALMTPLTPYELVCLEAALLVEEGRI